MFRCPLCTTSFKTRAHLNAHTTTHTKEKPYKCSICSATFSLPHHLKSHIRIMHNGVKQNVKKNLNCAECSYKFSSQSSMATHMRKHSAEFSFCCNVPGCSFMSKHKGNLSRHLAQAHSYERLYACHVDGCNYKGKLLQNLKQHLDKHSKERLFACTFIGCRFTCKRKGGLNPHIFKVHSDDKPFKCTTCDFRTKYKRGLLQHEDAEHMKIQRFRCQAPNCSFVTHHPGSLRRHFDSKHKKKEVPCNVPGCNNKYGSLLLLQRHAKDHWRPILKCPAGDSCNFSTKLAGILRSHVASQHADDQSLLLVLGQPVLQNIETAITTMNSCPFPNCDYQSEFPHRYDRHVMTHDEGNRKYLCKFCSRRFKNSWALKIHIMRHTTEKPYGCSLCDNATVNSTSLRYHARNTHQIYVKTARRDKTGDLKTCGLCGASCRGDSEFVLHSMRHLQPVVVLQWLSLRVI